MTKRKVATALDAIACGRLADARHALRGVASTFTRRRLEPVLRDSTSEGATARALWHLLDQKPPMTLRDEDAALLSTPAPPSRPSPRPPRLIRFPERLELEHPSTFLAPLQAIGESPSNVDLDEVRIAQIWSLVGLAVLARSDGTTKLELVGGLRGPASQFAYAVGLNEVIRGVPTERLAEPERTVPLIRITRMEEIEKAASRISSLIIQGDEDSRKTLYYVLVELLRNVIQHSDDPLGGVVAAQRMDVQQGYPRRVIQVAVGDAGVGILKALSGARPAIKHPKAAVTAALEPHVSGAFAEGQSGSKYNAGMGLFFIAEMAKLTAGRLIVATRGAALYLHGDLQGLEDHTLTFAEPDGTGFPGTLVAFELPLDEVQDHEALLETIRTKAYERAPRTNSKSLLRWTETPKDVPVFAIAHLAENTVEAESLAKQEFQQRILMRTSVALDFRGIEVCTQSFLHSLLFETLRLAWAFQTEVYVTNAGPAVVSGLKLVENYALSG